MEMLNRMTEFKENLCCLAVSSDLKIVSNGFELFKVHLSKSGPQSENIKLEEMFCHNEL